MFRVFLIGLIISFNSFALEVNMNGLKDMIGKGQLSRGLLGNNESQEIIESDVCAIRETYPDGVNQSVEMDFLGLSEVFPSDFVFNTKDIEIKTEEKFFTYIKKLTERDRSVWGPVFNKYVCETNERAFSASLELDIMIGSSVAIRWVASCLDKKGKMVERYYQLKCK